MQTSPSPSPVSRYFLDEMPACACDRCERTRVREHLLGAIEEIVSRPADTPSASRSRALLVAELVRYAVAGTFPRNEDRSRPLGPIFVDRIGTRCAVGHLLDRTGEAALVDEVTRTANHAVVDVLARDDRLQAWLARVGLTSAEAARIQPFYCCPDSNPVRECACDLPGLDALVVGTVIPGDGGAGEVIVVDETYGAADLAVGEVIEEWAETQTYVQVLEGHRVLLGLEASTAYLLYNVIGSDVRTSFCGGCPPIYDGPSDVPLDVFIAVAEGASCTATFSDQAGWEPQTGCMCTTYVSSPSAAAGQGGGSDGAAGAAPADGSSGGGEGGAGPVVTPADDGCGVGGGTPDPTAALLWALAAGLALRRRRLERRD